MTLTIAKALQQAKMELTQLDAEVLLAYVLGAPRSIIYSTPEKRLTEAEWLAYQSCVSRRINREPVAYITGKKEFWSLELMVTADTLIPRPETELLVETILKKFDHTPRTVADIGTGSGAIAIALAKERPDWRFYACDISQDALAVARANANTYHLTQISFHHGHFLVPLPHNSIDIIVSNPPYLTLNEWEHGFEHLQYEPKCALVPEEDRGKLGIAAFHEIVMTAKDYLKSNGFMIVEHGFLQGSLVRAIFVAEEYIEVHTLRDLAGHERATYGRLKVT